jgi:hypothetical protein
MKLSFSFGKGAFPSPRSVSIEVDGQAASNDIQPSEKRFSGIVAREVPVGSQEGFLYEILGVYGTFGE